MLMIIAAVVKEVLQILMMRKILHQAIVATEQRPVDGLFLPNVKLDVLAAAPVWQGNSDMPAERLVSGSRGAIQFNMGGAPKKASRVGASIRVSDTLLQYMHTSQNLPLPMTTIAM